MSFTSDFYSALEKELIKKKKKEQEAEEAKAATASAKSDTSDDFSSRFYSALAKEKQRKEKETQSAPDDDLAPVTPTTAKKDEKVNGGSLFSRMQSEAFSAGDDPAAQVGAFIGQKVSDLLSAGKNKKKETASEDDYWQKFFEKWGGNFTAEDFSTLSVAGESKIDKDRKWYQIWKNGGDGLYDFINNIDDYRRTVEDFEESQEVHSRVGKYGDWTPYAYMSEDEIALYNYIYATQGKDVAEEMLGDLAESLNYRAGAAEYESMKDWQKAFQWLPTGVEQTVGGIEQFNSMLLGEDKLPTSPQQHVGMLAQAEANEKSRALGLLNQAATTTSAMLPSIAVGFLNPVAGGIVQGVSSAGSGYGQKLGEGYTKEQAATYGVLTGALEGGLQYAIGGIQNLGGISESVIMKNVAAIENAFLRGIAKHGVRIGAEVLEEELQLWLEPLVNKIATGEEYTVPELEEMVETAIATAMSTGLLNISTDIVSGDAGTVNGLTVNEAKVVNKLTEDRISERQANSKKLSSKDKSKIYDDVIHELESGEISTDEIESILGGDEYVQYQKEVNKETEIAEQEKSINEKIAQLEAMPESKITVGERNTLNELYSQRDSLDKTTKKEEYKKSLSDKVKKILQSDRHGRGSMLLESYNERSRRGQAFEADLSQYDESQRTVVQNAISSGILNNTNRTHKFVDMIAKISADKGVSFDFADNAKLKASGFAMQNAVVNGYVTKDGTIGININSAKALNTVVGHEITHVLEGTELYDTMATAIKEYAESKGDYADRLAKLTELYSGKEGYTGDDAQAKIEQEVIADLVGDYLFTDADFINSLSVNHRNVFEKIYDEIKYLCKVATAGSEQAKKLEEVKKLFAEAYRAEIKNTTQEDGVRYSLIGVDADGIEIYETSEETKKLSYSERKKVLLNSILNDYKGRTAKFVKNGEIYYAFYDEAGVRKNLYGDYKSDKKGFRAKVNIGADGNYIELAENAIYTGSSKEIGKQTVSGYHENAKSWDYYVKTVKSDGRYFDVLINVKDTGNDNYVYDMTLKEADSLPSHKGLLDGNSSASFESSIAPLPENVNGVIYSNEKVSLSDSDRKAKQLDIILENNPATNTYSTWIRDVSDIKTFEETLQDSDWDGWEEGGFDPDYTPDMVRQALESGKITVYSSYPISQGVFVTPSRMEAESYSRDGKAYSKTVALEDVAWIDPTQGQYAKVDGGTKVSLSETGADDLAPVTPTGTYNETAQSGGSAKYSLSENLEKIEKILYDKRNPLSVVNRATTRNNSSMNWVYKAKIFSIEENKQFHEKISQINQGGKAFQQNSSGEYMLPIENKIVFTDGDYDAPYISEIIEVLTEYATEFEVVKERIFGVEKGKLEKSEAVRVIAQVLGDGAIVSYRGGDNGVYGWQDGKRKGATRRTVIRNYLNQQFGRGNDSKSEEARISETGVKASSKGDAFSLSQNDDLAPVTPTGTYNVYGKDVALEDELAPMPEATKAISKPLGEYPTEKREMIKSYLHAVDEKIKNFVQKVKAGDLTFKSEKISDVSERAMGDINKLLGLDVNGYSHNINTNGIQHIIVRHGVNGKQDSSMAVDDDIARIGWVLENYDSVELLKENGDQTYSSEFMDASNNPAPQIRFIKKIDGTYYVVEAVFENGHKKLWVQSAYLQKNEDVTQAPAEGNYTNHEANAQSALASPSSDSIIAGDAQFVNRDDLAPLPEATKAEAQQAIDDDLAPTSTVDWDDILDAELKQAEVNRAVGDRNAFTSRRADELYQEIKNLQKGVKASDSLGYLMDHGYEWQSIKTALLNIRNNPDRVINANSPAETVARKMLSEEYDSFVESLSGDNWRSRLITEEINNLQSELENDIVHREQSLADYDAEIAQLHEAYDGLKNKNTKKANDLLRRIERRQRMKNNVDADYARRIDRLEVQIEKLKARLAPTDQTEASVLTEEPQKVKKKPNAWAMFKRNFIDRGTVFETMSLKKETRSYKLSTRQSDELRIAHNG